MKTRSYTELCRLKTFEERFEYLKLQAIIGEATFGTDRYLNQIFYHDRAWKRTRDGIIIRDDGCDLGMSDYPIPRFVIVHHIIPITIKDIEDQADCIYDPENLICTSDNTHNAIHYRNASLLPRKPVERYPGDTCLWHSHIEKGGG